MNKKLKIALVHDYLREYGGAERVLETLHEMFPDAPIYTAYYNPDGLGPHRKRIEKWDIHTSWMQSVPFANKLVSPFRIFAPMMFESFDLKSYDVVISSCAIYFSKAVITKPESLHLSYIHTPPRYLYGYTTSFNYKKNLVTRFLGEIANHFLRLYDFETSQRPDVLIANSKNVAARIKKFYRRDATVIYPPVEVEELKRLASSVKEKDGYFLSLSRLVRGKGVDVIVKACTDLNLPLKIAGSGPERESLKKIAGENVEFLGEVSDAERIKLYADAKALIVAPEDEDFGITAVESMAAGTPVIAVGTGGYLETVVPGITGEFFSAASSDALKEVLQKFDSSNYKEADCKRQADKFSKESFKKSIVELINSYSKK